MLDTAVLTDILQSYAEFLPIPITIGDDNEPVNAHPAPWQDNDDSTDPSRTARYMAWVEARRETKPLDVIPLTDIQRPDGTLIPLRGVLYVPPRSIISIQEYGDVTVYVRHMLITESERDLLPSWARFVTGVIDCPSLNPTASRETLRHDETFISVQEALAQQLLTHFTSLAQQAPADWEAIIHAHNDLIKGWAVRAQELFIHVADLVSFKTSRGQLTIPEYLRQNPGRIFYYSEDDGVTQALALFEARRLAVIDARWFADVAFLKAYGDIYGITVEELKPAAGYLFTSVDDTTGEWEPVLVACRKEGFPVRLLSFEPEHLPMIVLYPPGAERLRRAQRNMEEGRFAGPLRSLVRGYLNRQQIDETVIKGVLHLNVRNPLLRRVRDMGNAHPDFAPLISVMVANARMFAGQGLSAQDVIACFEQINHSLAHLAGLEDTSNDGKYPLTIALLAEYGIHPDAAGRLCAECETVEDFLSIDIQQLAEQTGLPLLTLTTLREEMQATNTAETKQSGTIIAFTHVNRMEQHNEEDI
jgi:molecular chaperone HtpG